MGSGDEHGRLRVKERVRGKGKGHFALWSGAYAWYEGKEASRMGCVRGSLYIGWDWDGVGVWNRDRDRDGGLGRGT